MHSSQTWASGQWPTNSNLPMVSLHIRCYLFYFVSFFYIFKVSWFTMHFSNSVCDIWGHPSQGTTGWHTHCWGHFHDWIAANSWGAGAARGNSCTLGWGTVQTKICWNPLPPLLLSWHTSYQPPRVHSIRDDEWYPENRGSWKSLARSWNLGNVSTESRRLVFFLFGSEIARVSGSDFQTSVSASLGFYHSPPLPLLTCSPNPTLPHIIVLGQ